ncbi:SBBP repeat-containing protein [Kordiimonas lacus]|uniref:Beta-propeller repeat-containing protein n=1 Tax=Kordiimonas lacus TaxID=637679 RepID=A0A1G6U5A0_9PROT|nr:SBBP repeat-containing protein [Kordiimonas lacus]SDD35856.1 Beta-propeller repeat-containing protein [Kordiimonas lacus]
MAFFGGTSFSGLFGPTQQQTFRPQIVGIDTSLIAMSVDAKMAQRSLSTLTAEQRAAFSLSGRGDAVIPPWQVPEESKTLSQQIREVRELTKFIDLKADDLDAVGDADKKATFALYKALNNLRVLAEYASQDSTSTSSLSRLNDQFQAGLDEVRDFLSTADLEKLDLFLGDKEYKTEATTRLGKNSSESNGSLITTDPNAAIDGLVGDEVFTISVTKSGETDDIQVDLSGVSGTLSLNNIKDYINTQIEALTILDSNGDPTPKHLTRFDVRRDGDSGKYSLQIDGTITEEVTLSAAVTTPTLYVASAVSQLDDDFAVTSRITEINGLDGTLAIDDVTSFSGIDYEASAVKEQVAEQEDDDLDPKIASLRDKLLAESKEDVTGTSSDDEEEDSADNELSITNVNSDYQVNADTTASRVAVDSEGGIYVVGTSDGSFGHQLNTASGEDVFLTKFDTEGNVVFSRLLGVAGDADAYGITVDSEDNVIVVGKTDSELSTSDVIDSTDAFVTKISKRGDEVFRYQLDTFGESAAYSVAVDSNNDIYVGGYTKSAISSTSGFTGGQDAMILKLSGSDGSLQDSSVFGTSGNDVIKGIAIDGNDDIVVAVEEGGDAVVYRLDATDLSDTTNFLNMGSLGTGGSIQGIAIDNTNSDVYIAGVTTNSALDASGTATVVGTAEGGFEGFVSALSLNGKSNLKAESTTYLSTSGTDRINDVVVVDQVVYVAGSTAGTLSGETARGSVDAFVARVDGKTGALEDMEQYGEGLSKSAVGGLAFTTQGNSVLETLGLPTGTVNIDETLDIQTQTSAKEGDFFYISVDGGTKKKITLSDGDTFDDLKRKLRIAGFGKIDVDVASTAEGDKLTISTLDDGVSIDLLPGTGDRDLLERIGLEPGKLLPKNEVFGLGDDEEEDGTDPDNLGGAFGLGLKGELHIKDKATAKYVLSLFDGAISSVQRAFRSLEYNPLKALIKEGRSTQGTVPAHLQAQLANFQTGLARLQSGASSPSLSLFV